MKITYHYTPLLLFLLLFNSCKKDKVEDTTSPPSSIHLKFNFAHTVDGAALERNVITYSNAAENKYSIVDLRYFVSSITLHKGNDSVLIDEAHYVDITESKTLSYTPTQLISNGNYDRISLIVGLNSKKNVSGYFVNPPESNMAWPDPMGGGYHYMQLEGKYDSAGVTKNLAIHTGKLMGDDYSIYIKLGQSSFKANGSDLTINLTMNINEWFKNPYTYNFNSFGDTVMMSSTAQKQLQKNGMDVFSVNSIQ